METRAALFAKKLSLKKRWNILFALSRFSQDLNAKDCRVKLFSYRPLLTSIEENVLPRFRKHRWRIVIHLDKRDLDLVWHLPFYLFFRMLPKCLINRFWTKMEPDVVCCFGNNSTSAEVIADCERAGIKTVLCVASDKDLSEDFSPGNMELDRFGTPKWMAWFAIKTADLIMVQTPKQRELLKSYFARDGVLVRNPVQFEAEDFDSWIPFDERDYVLWVGRSESFNKRPLLVIELARRCPEISFLLIVNRKDVPLAEQLQRERPLNVRILEHVPHPEMKPYFGHARLLINTSRFEGFPNTFLQAAVSGAGVV
jgi:hypothetical protein